MSEHAPTTFDLSAVPLELGVAKTIEIQLYLPPLHLAGQDYHFVPDQVAARLTVNYVGQGYAVSLGFKCRLEGVCWRCLEVAGLDMSIEVDDFLEIKLPPIEEMREEEEASPWYTEDGMLNVSAWARDAVAEKLPLKILCQPGCMGLCAQCGANLNLVECGCEQPVDSRWDKLKEWKAD
ncbi:MAG: DUF177 domain-containing protein [Thermoleophilia bacterium]